MSMKKQKKSIVSVRLSKTSSARPVLNNANRNNDPTDVERIAKILDDDSDKKYETTHGKLPVEAAYIIMKRITEASGQPVKPVGLSTFNKLQSLRTEPALKLLLNQTWHNFFVTQEAERKQRAPQKVRTLENSNSTQSLNTIQNTFFGTYLDTNTRKSSPQRRQQSDVFENIQPIFNNLCSRVEDLWYKLSMSRADQQFYRKSLLRGPAESFEQCKEVANYIEMLQLHYQTTITVLESIRLREENIAKCYTLLLSLADKYNTQMQQQQAAQNDKNSGGNTSRPTSSTRRRETSGIRAKFENIASRQYQHSHSLEHNMYWKEELLLLLDAIRCNTLDVVHDIQEWRQWLYRPLPFIWNGVNYLEKIKFDMSILETDNYIRICECIPLKYEDLLGVVFFPPGGQPEQQPRESDSSSSAPKNIIQNDEYISSILQEFTSNIDREELFNAAMVVLEDSTLQEAIGIEGQSLLQRGVFIPTLKLSPLSSSVQASTANGNTHTNNNSSANNHAGLNHHDPHRGRGGVDGVAASSERRAKNNNTNNSNNRPQSGNHGSSSSHNKQRDQSHLSWLQEQEREQMESGSHQNKNHSQNQQDEEQI